MGYSEKKSSLYNNYYPTNKVVMKYAVALFIGLARTAPHTNTNFRLTFLLTRLQEALYRASNKKTTITLFHSGSQFLAPVKKLCFMRFIHNNNHFIIIINFFIWVFLEYTKVVTRSLIPIDASLPDICTFIIGFSCTAWTKMRSLRAN